MAYFDYAIVQEGDGGFRRNFQDILFNYEIHVLEQKVKTNILKSRSYTKTTPNYALLYKNAVLQSM